MGNNIPSLGINFTLSPAVRAERVAWHERQLPVSTGTALAGKEQERQRLAAAVAAFEAGGGRIERLPTTPANDADVAPVAPPAQVARRRRTPRAPRNE